MPESTPSTPEQVTLARLEDQIAWYGRKSGVAKRRYMWMKCTTILSAAMIPVMAAWTAIPHGTKIAMGLGVLITIIESFLQLSQSQQHWISYRATAEGLKHEKYLYLGQAGRYSDASNRQALLADKVETLISSENTNWIDTGNQGGAKSAKAGA
jgi:hypothetical protein